MIITDLAGQIPPKMHEPTSFRVLFFLSQYIQ